MLGAAAPFLTAIDGSPVAWGLAALAVNLGARFVQLDYLTPDQAAVLARPVIKRFVVVCMVFLVTRNLMLSFAITAALAVMAEGLLRPGSRLCVLPRVLGGCAPPLHRGRGRAGGPYPPPPPPPSHTRASSSLPRALRAASAATGGGGGGVSAASGVPGGVLPAGLMRGLLARSLDTFAAFAE